ncbi:uncharacterized protein BX663DRAFT_52338 [Cokeromyces recurvatus]|uniref:uncharacterized protein n=1 Tax=Cokeromyces recurvatus TaxID=90255 RepID=UPI00221E9D69|nr:uncharacterized protein BX663DRAFT_52338 [Cokeromyces recurvatus]KAI7902823.1 hypothetical protein BX663DRAFT_52338 [Cokeromyces recurvatus]
MLPFFFPIHICSLIYLFLDKTDLSTKITIREKLQEVEERVASTINSVTNKAYQATVSTTANDSKEMSKFSSNNLSTVYMDEREDSMTRFKRFGQYIINVIVTCAILIKQSPLPDLISFIFGYIIQLFLWIDTQYHILEKAQDASIQCIKFGLEADERYHVHEFLTEGFYMLVTAGLKVAIAYKETPRYKDNPTTKYQYTNYQKQTNSTNKVDNSITNMCDLLSNHKNNSQCTKFPITNSTSSTSSTSWAWLSW